MRNGFRRCRTLAACGPESLPGQGEKLQKGVQNCFEFFFSIFSCALCYVGKLDPANRPELLDNFQVPNLPNQPDPCSAHQEEWMQWKDKILHGVRFETDEKGNIVISTTFSAKT